MSHATSKSHTVFQDSLFDSSRIVERTLDSGTIVRMKLEPLGDQRVRVLEYYRKLRGGAWHRCTEEEGRIVDYERLRMQAKYHELFGIDATT